MLSVLHNVFSLIDYSSTIPISQKYLEPLPHCTYCNNTTPTSSHTSHYSLHYQTPSTVYTYLSPIFTDGLHLNKNSFQHCTMVQLFLRNLNISKIVIYTRIVWCNTFSLRGVVLCNTFFVQWMVLYNTFLTFSVQGISEFDYLIYILKVYSKPYKICIHSVLPTWVFTQYDYLCIHGLLRFDHELPKEE